MDSVKPRYSKEEFAIRGDAIYEKNILPKLTDKDVGKFVAIDIETGAYEIAGSEMKAGDKLLARFHSHRFGWCGLDTLLCIASAAATNGRSCHDHGCGQIR